MNAAWLAILTNAILSSCLTTIDQKHQDIKTKTKIQLDPIHISCMPNDIVQISAPIVNDQTEYYLHKPNGDVTKLYLGPSMRNEDHGLLKILFRKNLSAVISSDKNFKVFNLAQAPNILESHEAEMGANDFLLGPLLDEDHGNWVLSVYTKDFNDEWVELFQVITIEIVEFTLIFPKDVTLTEGSTFHLSYAYPVLDLESCQLIAPASTYDRFYDRNPNVDMDRCGFVVPNVTKADEGQWRIIGVGRIVYEGVASLYVKEKKKKRKKF